MIKIEIDTAPLRELKGISSKSGRPYHMRFQEAYAFIVDGNGKPSKYPEKFEVSLATDQAPWPAGFYTLHPSSVTVREGNLHTEARLVPVKSA